MGMRYVVIVEVGDTSSGVHVPDFPKCAVVAQSRADVIEFICEAIDLYLAALKRAGRVISHSFSDGTFGGTSAA